MTSYNLIRNGSLKALTSSGTGDISLTFSQLETLQDQNLTSSGISITNSGTLYLEADLSQRIKIDGVRLYASDLTKSSNISFAFKNASGDAYTPLATSVSSYYTAAALPDPSAPRFVRAVVSGTNIELYEFQIFNDDFIVAFGEDGQTFAEYLQSTPIGTVGAPQAIAIYNNGTSTIPAVAYISLDYTATSGDNYVEISTSINGTYYSIDDGVLMEDDKDNSTYRWSMGLLNNTQVSSDKVVITTPTVGTYTTPIFKLDDQYKSSYFIIDGTTITGSISYDANVYNGTIRVRNSDTAPVTIEEVYWPYYGGATLGNDNTVIEKDTIYNGDIINDWTIWDLSGSYYPVGTAVDRRNGNVLITLAVFTSGQWQHGQLRMYDRSGSVLYDISSHPRLRCDTNIEFDKFGGFWGYGNANSTYYGYLIHYDNNLSTLLYELYNGGTDFVYDLAVEMNGDGVWYTNKSEDILYHLDGDGTTLHTIPLDTPRAICGTLDNGCWVIDNGIDIARRYNSSGVLVSSVAIGRNADRAAPDMNNGFWYLSGNHLYHVTSGGSQDISDVEFDQPTKIKGGHNGCIVWSNDQMYVKYVNNAGSVTRTFSMPTNFVDYEFHSYPALFSSDT